MVADIAVPALASAKSRGYVAGNAIFHADHGAQYASRLLVEWARANERRVPVLQPHRQLPRQRRCRVVLRHAQK